MDTGEAGGLGEVPAPTAEERLQQAHDQITQMHAQQNQLQQELDVLRKGKGVNQGRLSWPPYCPNRDRFSIPWPLQYDPPNEGPVGMWNEGMPPPFLGVKPILLKLPTLFKGEHDDIDQFIGDCLTYFETFRHYFHGIQSMIVVFTALHFEGPTQDCWVHHREVYWTEDEDDEEPPWYRYPRWTKFVKQINDQFHDPAIEEVHEKKMYELRMGNNPATVYFQKLEQEAKLAGWQDDKSEHGTMVCAIWAGVPISYTSFITNIGIGILCTYGDWKEHILLMYKEHQQKWVYNQTHGNDQCSDKKSGNQKQITTTSSNKNTTGGTTSSSTNKMAGEGKGHDSAGRWATYGGAGRPMDIDRVKHMSEGLCFICHKKGHISKNCLDKMKKVEVHAVEAEVPLSKDTKIKEVKE